MSNSVSPDSTFARPAVPLPGDAVAATLAPFGHSVMLPADACVDEAVLAWERRWIFEAGWICLGRLGRWARGTQHAVALGTSSVLITNDGRHRVFANICRHRGHEILPCGTSSDRDLLMCPYHSWSYGLDGSLLRAPRFDGVPNFSRETFGLAELRTETWGGWLFVNVDGRARTHAEHRGRLTELAAPYRCDELVSRATQTYDIAANWKLIVENYHECYHCASIHPELCRVTVPTSGENYPADGSGLIGGSMLLLDHAQTMSFDGATRGSFLPGLHEQQRRHVIYVGLFPDLLLALHPDYVMTHRLEPLTASSTRLTCEWLFPSADIDPSYAVEFWDVVNRQDWAAAESVQRNLESPSYRPGVLARHEDAVYQFVTMVARAYVGDEVS